MKMVYPALFLLFLVHCALGEVELVCPKPIGASEDVTVQQTTYTELTPGLRTIVFKETKAIEGAPFKLSIMRQTNQGIQECVLLDHIPWQKDSKMYYVTVNIPNYQCRGATQSCRLVVWQIDTPSSNGYCNMDMDMAGCTSYNSTAAVSIRMNNNPAVNTCPKSWGNWPFDPMKRYTSTLTGTQTTARATGTFHLVGHTILYYVNVTMPFSDGLQPSTLKFVYFTDDSSDPMELGRVSFQSGNTEVMGSWTDVSDFAAYVFRNMTLYAHVMASDSEEGMIMGMITPQNGMNGVYGVYGLEYGMYTSSGWLAGEMFVGPDANATWFTQPHGPCIMDSTQYYGCMLSSSSSMGGGTVAMQLTGNRLWFSMDMYNVSSAISSVMLMGTTAGVDDVDLTSFWSDGYRLRGLTDVSDNMALFLSTGSIQVSISTMRNTAEMTCTLNEGMIAILDSIYEVPSVVEPSNGTATAFLYFSVDGSLNYQITLNNLTSILTGGHIHGPANQGQASSNIPVDASEYIMGQMDWGWNIMGTKMNLTASEFRYMVESLTYLNMHTDLNKAGELRGQVSPIGNWICPEKQLTNHCYWAWLTVPEGTTVNNDRTPMGVGGVVIDRYERLQYSLALWYIPTTELTLTVTMMTTDGMRLQQVQVTNADDSDIRNNVKEIYGVYPEAFDGSISLENLLRFENGEVWFNVTSTNYPSGLLSGYIPPLMRSRCTGQMSYTVRVGGANGWIPTGSIYPSMRTLAGDKLEFTFSSPDNLYKMANKNRLTGCVFTPTTATLLADAETTSPNTYVYDIRNSDYHYFSSSESCENQNMKLTVYSVDTVPEVDRLESSTCATSLYSFSEDQRNDQSSNAFAGAITATIIGLIIGTILTVFAIVIGVFVMIKGKVSSGDSGDMSKKS